MQHPEPDLSAWPAQQPQLDPSVWPTQQSQPEQPEQPGQPFWPSWAARPIQPAQYTGPDLVNEDAWQFQQLQQLQQLQQPWYPQQAGLFPGDEQLPYHYASASQSAGMVPYGTAAAADPTRLPAKFPNQFEVPAQVPVPVPAPSSAPFPAPALLPDGEVHNDRKCPVSCFNKGRYGLKVSYLACYCRHCGWKQRSIYVANFNVGPGYEKVRVKKDVSAFFAKFGNVKHVVLKGPERSILVE